MAGSWRDVEKTKTAKKSNDQERAEGACLMQQTDPAGEKRFPRPFYGAKGRRPRLSIWRARAPALRAPRRPIVIGGESPRSAGTTALRTTARGATTATMRAGAAATEAGTEEAPAAAGTMDGAETGAGILDPAVGMMEDPPEKRAIATAVPAVGGTSATISGREIGDLPSLGSENRSRRGGREGHISHRSSWLK